MDTENKFDDEEKNKDDTSQILSLTDEPSEEKDKNIIDRLLFGWSNWLDELINGKKEEEKPSGKPEDGDGNESTEEDNPSEDKEDVNGLDLLHKQIIIVPKLPEDGIECSFVVVVFDNFTINPNNPDFKLVRIRFDIVCPYTEWVINEDSLRPYLIM
jgi:hypothetical protein